MEITENEKKDAGLKPGATKATAQGKRAGETPALRKAQAQATATAEASGLKT